MDQNQVVIPLHRKCGRCDAQIPPGRPHRCLDLRDDSAAWRPFALALAVGLLLTLGVWAVS